MKAVFTGNPYKFWIHDNGGELHLFNNDEAADEFNAQLETEYDFSYCDCMTYVCDNPAYGPEFAATWAQLLYDYGSCCGYDKLVLHIDGERDIEFIQWTLEFLANGMEISWTWNMDSIDATIRFTDDFWNTRKNHDKCAEALCNILFELYDCAVCDIYDEYGNFTGEETYDWREMIAA